MSLRFPFPDLRHAGLSYSGDCIVGARIMKLSERAVLLGTENDLCPPPAKKKVFFQMPIEKEVSESFVAPATNDEGDVNENGQNQD